VLKSIQKHSTLKKFAGQTIGVDAYGWLHRGVVGCAFALAMDKPTTIHIDFVMSRVRMLLDFGVTPYLIFDGDNLPSKAGTNAARRKRREESRALGLELHRAGKASQAHQELQKAVDVTPVMARQLIEELKKLQVQYIVAPYEADAQLVYLEQKGIIDGILSEDSDLLVFGAKRLLTKLNQYGELVEVERADFALCKEMSLAGWTDTMFMRMAILSGCDYLQNIEKLGLKTAHAYVRKYKDIEKILRVIQFEGKLVVPDSYLERFRQAELTFLHHRVFCPIRQEMVFLTELGPETSEHDMPYLGPHVEPDTAIGVACGDLDPFTKTPIQLKPSKSIARPVFGENRPQSYATPTELKPKKSIETFFKPRRQPLAELDPNSLTPSPSQQRLLERHQNTSWEPRLVSSAPGLRRAATSVTSSSVRTDHVAFLARASMISTHQPPKRPRLCSSSSDVLPTPKVEQSPFFCSKDNDDSPLATRKTKTKKSRQSKFDVFSDTSSPRIPLDPEILQKASPYKDSAAQGDSRAQGKGFGQGTDAPEAIPQSSPTVGSPSWTTIPAFHAASPSRMAALDEKVPTPTNVVGVNQGQDLEAFEDLLEHHVRRHNEVLLKTFAFQSTTRRNSAMRSLTSSKEHPTTFSARSPEAQLAALSKLPTKGKVDALCQNINLQKTYSYQSPEVQQSALEALGRPSPSTPPACVSAGNAISEAESILATPLRHTAPDEARGSEDFMVPNSEDEASEIGSPVQKSRLDLSSFAFVSA
jgi:exonuclease-1